MKTSFILTLSLQKEPTMSDKQCCQCCPFAFSEESEQAQNYGCLPTPFDIKNMRVHHGKTWACHETGDTPCVGSIKWLKDNDSPHKVVDAQLLNEQSEWEKFVHEVPA